MNLKHLAAAAALALAGTTASAAIVLSEGFDDVGALAGAGWATLNESTPVGSTGWFQGDNTSAFAAADGPDNSYIAANYLNAAAGGAISNWLFTPEVTLGSMTTMAFKARVAGQDFLDTIEVYFSGNGASTSTVDFMLLGSYSSSTDDGWANLSFGAASAAATGRFAIRYVVGDTSVDGNYIGVDSLVIRTADATVSTPATLALAGLALAALGATRRKV